MCYNPGVTDDAPRILDPADVPADWLTVEAAIRAYGKSERTIRRLLKARQLTSVQVQGPFGLEWRIAPPAGPAPETRADPARPPSAALIPLDQVERLMAPLLDERETLRDELATERAARLEDARQIGQLEGRLAALEAELERLRDAPGPSHPPAPVTAPDTRRRWPWQR